jgi:DNA-binding FadR family transcriptional regulator
MGDPFDDIAARDRIRVPKTSELIANELRRLIVRGELNEGDALPPEASLMLRFGVSRPTLREAFRILESERLLSIARGARGGPRVHHPNLATGTRYTALLLQARGVTLEDVYMARLTIEPPAARVFAEVQPPEGVAALRACLDAEVAAIDTDRYAVPHHFARFHQLVIEGAGNLTMSVLAGMLVTIIEKHLDMEMAAKRGWIERERDNRRAYKAHRRLTDLIEAGDGAAAESFWRHHMEVAGELLLRDLGRTSVVDLLG